MLWLSHSRTINHFRGEQKELIMMISYKTRDLLYTINIFILIISFLLSLLFSDPRYNVKFGCSSIPSFDFDFFKVIMMFFASMCPLIVVVDAIKSILSQELTYHKAGRRSVSHGIKSVQMNSEIIRGSAVLPRAILRLFLGLIPLTGVVIASYFWMLC